MHSTKPLWNVEEPFANLFAAAPELLDAVKLALHNDKARLYSLPASDDYETSAQKDILSSSIGTYRAAIAKAEGKAV